MFKVSFFHTHTVVMSFRKA